MKNTTQVNDKKQGNGNGNSVINNYEHSRNNVNNYVSGDASSSSSAHKFQNNSQNKQV